MKRLSSRRVVAIFSLAAAAWSAASQAQSSGWFQISPPPHPIDDRNLYFAVSVLPSQIVLVGRSGVIFQTTDEGMTWTRPDSGTRVALTAVSFAAQAGIAVGEAGTILRSDDGGLNWTAQFSGTTGSLGAVSVVDADTAIAVGEGGIILRTDDGGITWTSQKSGTALTLNGVSFTDSDTGTVVGEAGTILRTDDGGVTWPPQESGTTLTLNGVSFSDADTGSAVGEAGTILRTGDGGATWIPQFSGTVSQLINVTFVDANTGWVVVENVQFILRTIDGGEHWTPQHIDRSVEAVSFADPNTGTVVGNAGFLARTTDGGITWGPYPPAPPPPNDAVVDVCLVDANTGWAVTNALDGILRTTDGGRHWTRQPTGWFNAIFRRIACVDSQTVTVVGSDGLGIIVRTIDGGEHWTRQGIGVTGVVLKGVSFLAPDIGTITGDEAGILHTTDGGATWTPLSFPSDRGPFDDVYQGSASQIIVTVVDRGQADNGALRTDDGGATWTFTQFGGLCGLFGCYFMNRITFMSANEWWAASQCNCRPHFGSVHHTFNGGATWSRAAAVQSIQGLNAVSFPSAATGIAVGPAGIGYGATIIRTTDFGSNWTQQYSGTLNELRAVSFIDDNIGIVAGAHETILRTTTGGD
jgi:photosystem II stability/assembly factor-like uncharacterized protein